MALDLKMDPRVFLDEDPTVQAIVSEMIALRLEQIREQKDRAAREEMRSKL